MSSGTDVFVIGGGPAGLAAAIAARQQGLDVIVADGNKPPIDKACGEGLMPDSVEALRRLGVELETGDGISFSGIRFVDERTTALASFSGRRGVGLRRTVLHGKMLERADACGVKFLWETPVTGLQSGGVKLAAGSVVPARWIVGADGSQSQVRHWAGLDFSAGQSGRYACRGHLAVAPWSDCVEINWADSSQAYVTPVSDHEVCVVVVSRQPDCRLPTALGEFPELARRLANAELSGKVRGAITRTRGLSHVYRGNVALIGDASGGVDAITGEGLSLSFHQAEALAEAMAMNDLRRYQQAHRRFARRPAFMAHVLLLLDGRTHLRHRVLKVFAKYPELFERLVSIHVGETTPAHFAVTGAQLGWRLLAS
jgi:menaquinone-9 beta-reductase